MHYDVIVIGAGTMGSSTCAYLAGSGLKVLGLEQFSIPHDQGSHSGYTRIIRQAYYEHPSYVPLLQRSYQLWHDLERHQNITLYHETGILYMGPSESSILKGTLEASNLYHIPVTALTHQLVNAQYPQFEFPDSWSILWEPGSGYLNVNQAITGFYQSALQAGASIHAHEKVESWRNVDSHIEVRTSVNTYHSDKLIFTAGPWTQPLVVSHALPLKVTRQVLAWVDTADSINYSHPNFPCWFLHDPQAGMYYGFPQSMTGDPSEPSGIKLGLHMPGLPADPDRIDRTINDHDREIIRYFIERYMPQLKANKISYKTCMYTYSPDEHFIIDYLPDTDKKVMIASGFSGHGFKFAPVIGEILTDLCHEKSSSLDIEFLSLRRFQI